MIFFKVLLGIATIAIIVFNIQKGFNSTSSTTKETRYIDSEITLSEEANTSILISWQSEENEIGSVEYGIMQNVYYQSESEESPTHMHKIRLESLKECTKYYYQVSSESMLFDRENGSFTTLCENGRIQ